MTRTPPASRIILEVERALEDLRRGLSVKLTGLGKSALEVSAGEYNPKAKAITDPAHPAVRLMKLAGLLPRAIVAPLKGKNAELLAVSADAVRHYPKALVAALKKISDAEVPMAILGKARVIAFRPRMGHEEHLAVVSGNIKGKTPPLVRVHSSCVTGDVFHSLRCDCGSQLEKALHVIAHAGAGVVLYLSQEGRGIGIASKLRAYNLQDKGLDTVEANEALGFAPDERDYAIAAAMLKQLGVTRIRLVTNNPAKIKALARHGIKIAGRAPLVTPPTRENKRYLDTKAKKMGHDLKASQLCDIE